MRQRPLIFAFIGFALILILTYFLPPVRERVDWRVGELQMWARDKISPPERAQFEPQAEAAAAQVDTPTQTPSTATPTTEPSPTAAPAESTPLPTATPTQTPVPLPPKIALKGVRYQDQHGLWNYCAPANLAMALSYWGWPGDRLEAGKVLKPYAKDKNVMPYEMADFVQEQTQLKVILRVGGDPDLIKRLLVAGFPVLIEKGAYIKDISGVVSWMGHYEVVTGYDDADQIWITQDSYYQADYEVPYDTFLSGWRSFNYTYLVIYAPEKEGELLAVLGPQQADEAANFQYAAQKASDEIYGLTEVDQFFAWFNRGTNLKELQDYAGAAAAYDEAFAIYNTLPEDKGVRPYRILWYETGPYFAYYYTNRYQAVISLATTAIDAALDEPAIEESFYWRAMARAALGDTAGADADFRESLKYHPDFEPTLYQMQLLGMEP